MGILFLLSAPLASTACLRRSNTVVGKSVGSLLEHRMLNRYVATYSLYLTTAQDAAHKPLHQVKVRSTIHYHSKLFRLFRLIHAVAVFCTSS